MKIIEKLVQMSVKVVQTSNDLTYYIRPRSGDVSDTPLVLSDKNVEKSEIPVSAPPEPEPPKHEARREGYYESLICPGLFFHKYQLDVEMNGQAGLTPTQFAILSILDDEGGGEVSVDRVKQECWEESPGRVAFANHITELNKKLEDIGVKKIVEISEGNLLFQ